MSLPILYQKQETNFNHLGLGILKDAISCLVTEERNGIFELDMEYPLSGALFDLLENDQLIKVDAGHDLKGQLFRIKRITKNTDGFAQLYAQHVSYLAQDLTLRPEVTLRGTGHQALEQWRSSIIDPNPFTVYSDVNLERTTTLTIQETENARRALGGTPGSILDIWGGEYQFDNYQIRLLENRGTNANTLISYGRNLQDLQQEENIANTFTSIYPFATYQEASEDGAQTRDILVTVPGFIVDSEHVEAYPNRRILPVDFSREFENNEVPTPNQLLQLAEQYIKIHQIGIPRVSLSVSFVDLTKALDFNGVHQERLNLCDVVPIYFEKLGIRARAKVVRTRWDVLLSRYETLEIGEPKATLSDKIRDIEHDINQIGNRPPIIGSENIANIPPKPVTNLEAVGGFGAIHLFWDNQGIYLDHFELHASLVSGFVPDEHSRIYRGRGNGFSHIVGTDRQHFYRCRGVNHHGVVGEWSIEVVGQTARIPELDQLEGQLKELDLSLEELEEKVIDLNETLPKLEQRLTENEVELADLNQVQLPQLQDELAELGQIVLPELDYRLSENEVALNDLNQKVLPQLDDRLTSTESDLETAQDQLNQALEQIHQESGGLGDLHYRLTQNEDAVEILTTQELPQLDGRLTNAQGQLETLNQTTLPNLDRRLSENESMWATAQSDIKQALTDVGEVATVMDLWKWQDTTDIDGGAIRTNTITARQINAGAITATEIASGTIVGDHLATNTITTREINANAITAEKIAGNTITGNKLAVNTITAREINTHAVTANEIAANTITANQIASRTITADQMATQAITANEIATHTITSDQIAANAIHANRLAITDFTNYAQLNRNTASQFGWTVEEVPNQPQNPWFRKDMISRDNVIAEVFEVVGGEQYRVTGEINTNVQGATTNGGNVFDFAPVGIGFRFRSADGTDGWIWSTRVTNGTGIVNSVITAPVNAKSAQLLVHLNSWAPFTGILRVRNIKVNRMASGELVVDGSILANHINTDSIQTRHIQSEAVTADEIAANTITANHIASRTLTAAEIAAEAITANEIATNTITANEIATGTLTATEIATETITANEIATNTITANEIATGTITAAEITAEAITANEIATNTITANQIATGTITAAEIAAEAITASKIATNTITANQIATDAIEARHIRAGAITADDIVTGTLQSVNIRGVNINGSTITSEAGGSTVTITQGQVSMNQSTGDNRGESLINPTQLRFRPISSNLPLSGNIPANLEVQYRPEGIYRRVGTAGQLNNFTHYINFVDGNEGIRVFGRMTVGLHGNADGGTIGLSLNNSRLTSVSRMELSHLTGNQSGLWFAPTPDQLLWNIFNANGNGNAGNDWLHISPFRPANAGGTIYNAQLMSFKRSGQSGSTTYESERASVRIMSGNVNVESSTSWNDRSSFVIVGQNFGVPRNGAGYNNINVWVSSTGNFGVRQPGQTSGNFRPIQASAFSVNSVRASKTHLKAMKELDETATHLINRTQLYEYDLVQEVESGIPHKNYGVMVEEAPIEITSRNGESIELYSMVSYAWKAIQELTETNDKLTKRIETLERGDGIGTK